MRSSLIPVLGGSLLLSALFSAPAHAVAKSWAQGTAAGADIVPHQEVVCYWIGISMNQSYECGYTTWGTQWSYRDSNFADTENDYSSPFAASAQGDTAQPDGGSSAAMAETAQFVNKARIETHSTPKGGATASATSEWSAGLLMNAPGNPVLTGQIVYRVQGSAHYTGDSEFSWNFTANYRTGGDPDSGDYATGQASVAGGTAAPTPIPGGLPVGGGFGPGNYTYLGTTQAVDFLLTLPFVATSGDVVFSAKLDLSGKSVGDGLTRVVVGGDFFDMDADHDADDWVELLNATVVDDKAQGDVLLDFSHTVTVAGLYVPQGVSVSLVGGGELPFPLFYTAPVPEPQTWAMLLAGLGLLGWAARRRTV